MSSKKVLLIDDDPVIAAVYESLFIGAGFDVMLAEDGEQGLAAVFRSRPDVVLLDLSMPKLNGLQWLDKVRKDARFAKLPVVVFTAGSIAWQVNAAKNSDATMVLSKKTSDPEGVVKAVKTAMETGNWRI
ncbi:MAG TPA: response regulator [Nevskiaceae bacterium]|nr:response regulator [Nevskiaceae bacterium]